MRATAKRPLFTAAAVGAAAALLLTGRDVPAIDNRAPAGSTSTAVWDFENTDAVSEKGSIEFVVSDGLLDGTR